MSAPLSKLINIGETYIVVEVEEKEETGRTATLSVNLEREGRSRSWLQCER